MKRGSSDLHHGGSSSDLVTSLRAVAFVVIAAHRFRIKPQLSRITPSAPASLGFVLLDVADDSPAAAADLLAFPPDLHSELQGLVRHRDSQALLHLGQQAGVADRLRTSLRTGIGAAAPLQEELASRQRIFGTNVYPRKHSKSFWHFLWSACQDVTLGILMLCAVLSLGFGIKSDGPREGWYDGASIAFAVILVIVVTAVSNYRQGRQFEKLNHEKENIYVQAIRHGRTSSVSIFDLVVGDLVQLRTGDQVPADGLCIEGHSLLINESSVTGESDAFTADPIEHPFLLSGCKVEDGFGLMLVTAVGIDTEWGKIMATISTDNNEQTPLQKRLDAAAKLIGYVGLTVALLVLVILIVFYFTGHTSDSSSGKFQAGKTSASEAMDSVVHILTIAVTIIVVAVPEGLPLAVTLTLAYSMRKMMADKALVRRLTACETMGSSTTICTDKTGTLTLNQMTVVKSWLAGVYTNHEDGAQVPVPIILKDVAGLLYEAIAQNTTGNVFMPPGIGVERAEVSGSPTEKALLRWGLKTGMQFEKAKAMSTVVKVNAFNSKKKRAGVAVNRINEGRVVIHWKGAAEIILSICSKWMDGGLARDMTSSKRKELLQSIEKMAEGSLRCIAFAYCEVGSGDIPEFLEGWELPETDLTLLAVVGMKDPCRPGVRSAVSVVKKAGVKVRMVTGDNLVTAKAIAKECGILEDNEAIVVEGSTFRNWTEIEMSAYLPHLAVLARALPSDKLLLVESLQARGNVVAVTGDGTNDAPALHKADIGLSMGVEGTEVAKESSDIIILDDNFSSIVKVVRWGRSISSNIQKFLQFQLTVNVAALVVNFVAAVSSGSVPLTAVQLLWVNLIMDTLGALALATEPPTDSLMLKPPVARDESLISNIMWRNLALQAAYQVTILLTLQFRGESLLHLSGTNAALVNRTIIFNTFVFCQIFNEVNARQPQRKNIFKGILDNRLFMGIIAVTLVLQVVMVEFLERFASTMRLDWHQWLICMGLASLSWPIGLVGKFIPVPSTPFSVWGIIKKAIY